MIRVMVLMSQIKQYRFAFYNQLYLALKQEGIDLKVAYGPPPPLEAMKGDNVDLAPPLGLKTTNFWLFNHRVLFQPLLKETSQSDLVIVEQANKHLINYLLLARIGTNPGKVAFWGHGLNRQGNPNSISERIKRSLLTSSDWWFAYTSGTARYLEQAGVSPNIITIVQNSIDTRSFESYLSATDEIQVTQERTKLGIPTQAVIGLFCGGLYADKRLGFLIESAERIRQLQPNFELLVIGNGADRPLVEAAAAKFPWIHYLGARFGLEKALYFRMADVFLMPGLVGLAVIDALVGGLPLVTTDIPLHSPEIDYLEHDVNGLMTPNNQQDYASQVANLLNNPVRLSELSKAAYLDGSRYTMETMVENFKNGVLKCLQH